MAEEIYLKLDAECRQIFAAPEECQSDLFAAHVRSVIEADQDGLFAEPDSITILNDDGNEETYESPHCKAAELIVYAWLLIGDHPWFEGYLEVIEVAQQLENPFLREEREKLWQDLKDSFEIPS